MPRKLRFVFGWGGTALVLSLAGCATGADPVFVREVRKSLVTYEAGHDSLVAHFDELMLLRDSLNQELVDQVSPEVLKHPAALEVYHLLLEEHEDNKLLYEAILQEYTRRLDHLRTWSESLENTEEGQDALQREWDQYRKDFDAFMVSEERSRASLERWRYDFQKTIYRFKGNYGSATQEAQSLLDSLRAPSGYTRTSR